MSYSNQRDQAAKLRVFSLKVATFFLLSVLVWNTGFAAPEDLFVEKPHLQLGNNPGLKAAEQMLLLWHTLDEDAPWSVEVQTSVSAAWTRTSAPGKRLVAIPGIPRHQIWTATLENLPPGNTFHYRVLKGSTVVFEANGTARKALDQDYRFVVFGDCAQNTAGQRAIAYQTYLKQPDFVFITGDIVYNSGRIGEYRTNYFPVYNADQASAMVGAPLIRSIPFLASPGNHDILSAHFGKLPDTMAYFYYWAQPLNGPVANPGDIGTQPLVGPEENRKAFLDAAGVNYPRMANFSFDYGNSHWTVLDANPYMDWTDESLRAWVTHDIASATNSTWHFVAFHQPGFNSSSNHISEQRMRLMADVFEKGKVDMVFSGHVHNYQRSRPLRFQVEPVAYQKSHEAHRADGLIPGEWVLDKEFDGEKRTKAEGVIYIVTGAGGAGLYNPEQQFKPETWQPFTHKYIADIHSLTSVEVKGSSLSVRQISETGQELDRLVLTK